MRKTILILSVIILASGCTENTKDKRKGKIVNSTYINEFVGLSLPLSDEWIVKSDSENNKIINETIELFANGEEQLKKNAVKLMKDNDILLNLTSKVDSSNVLIGIEKKKSIFRLPISARQYFVELKSILKHLPFNYQFINESEQDVILNSQEWHVLKTKRDYGNTSQFQDFYAKRDYFYYIVIISSYNSNIQMIENNKIIQEISLKE
jgi:hypothetical protein